MGISFSASANLANQMAVNETLQESTAICLARCTNEVENINIIVDNGSKVGDIVIDQQCQSDALCTIKHELQAITYQGLELTQNAVAESQGNSLFTWPGITMAVAANISNQMTYNTTTQLITSICEAEANNSVRDVNVYVSNNSEVAGFYINQSASATADCYIENTAKAVTTQTTSGSQVADAKSGSVLVIIFTMIAIAVIVLGMAYINMENSKVKTQSQSDVLIAAINSGNKNTLKAVINYIE